MSHQLGAGAVECKTYHELPEECLIAKFAVWISGQVRRVTAPIRREMKRRAAVEPVIGHIKAEHRMDRNYLRGRDGDRINARG